MATKTFDELSVSERILLVQDLWDQIAAKPEDVELTDAQRAELDRRLKLLRDDPQRTVPWSEVRASIQRRG